MKAVYAMALVAAIGVAVAVTKRIAENPHYTDNDIARVAAKINEQTPRMVTAFLRLDRVEVFSHQLRYDYTLVNGKGSDFSPAEITRNFEKSLQKLVCQNDAIKLLPQHGITVSFSYRGNDGAEITVVAVKPNQCLNALVCDVAS